MSDRPNTYMRMYWGDYLQDTGHLSAAEHGAYLLMIGHYFMTGKPLPDDDGVLRRITRMTASEWKASRPILASFFRIGGGLWRHGRIETELNKASIAYEKRAAAGRRRWGQGDSNAPALHPPDDSNAQAKQEHSAHASSTNHQPLTLAPSGANAPRALAAGLVGAVHDAVGEVWGANLRPPWPKPTDASKAQPWVDAGVTMALVAEVMVPAFRAMRARGSEAPPGSPVGYADRVIRDALKAGKPIPRDDPKDPALDAACDAYLAASRKWSDNGRQGPSPKPEDFGMEQTPDGLRMTVGRAA